jgi:hypothetical protein
MFRNLLENPNRIHPGTLQANARQLFPEVVGKSNLKFFDPYKKHDFDAGEKHVLLGISTYSKYDLQLLDDLDSFSSQWASFGTVSVFDLQECKDFNEVVIHFEIWAFYPHKYSSFTPYPKTEIQPPILGIWNGLEAGLFFNLHTVRMVLTDEGFLEK